jgi:hypothetical protein
MARLKPCPCYKTHFKEAYSRPVKHTFCEECGLARLERRAAFGRILEVFGSHPVYSERHWRQHEYYELPRKREFFAA